MQLPFDYPRNYCIILKKGKGDFIMVKINNFLDNNQNLNIMSQMGNFTVFEHLQDLSVSPGSAQSSYFMSQMGCTPKQVLITLNDDAIRLKPGAMQMMIGNISQETGVKSAGDLIGKALKAKVTGDNAIKPLYKGSGYIITEPTYAFPIIVNTDDWGGSIVCDDGMFICCDDELKDKVVARSNFSSAIAGGEGLFNLCLEGSGYAVLNSACPIKELYEITLENDCIKIDGNNAVCWSRSLAFTVERSGKSLLGSAASGEGLVNVYRGTGKILVAPLKTGGFTASRTAHTSESGSKSALASAVLDALT